MTEGTVNFILVDHPPIRRYKADFELESAYFISDHELGQIAKDTYGQYFELVPDYECHNYSHKVFEVEKCSLHEWSDGETRLQKFIETGYSAFLAPVLLADLANKGIIPEGKYVIDVSW